MLITLQKSMKNVNSLVLILLFIILIYQVSYTSLFCADLTDVRLAILKTDAYEYFDYLINSGRLSPRFLFNQPYSLNTKFLKGNTTINKILNHYLKSLRQYYSIDSLSFRLSMNNELYGNGSKGYNFYKIESSLVYSYKNFTALTNAIIDRKYLYDVNLPEINSYGEKWLYGRIDEAFVSLSSSHYEFFIGKTKRNWGPIAQQSLILSDNPYSYPHIYFSFFSSWIKYSQIFAQLNSVDQSFEFNQRDSSFSLVKNANRFLTGHRIDFNFLPNVKLGFSEMAIYGGDARQIEVDWFNPLDSYLLISHNEHNRQMNGLWALDLFFKPSKTTTTYLQFLVDDIIVNNDPEINDRHRYPDRLGLLVSIRNGDTFMSGLNTNVTYIKVWNRTYQSMRSYENYHYYMKSLGYPAASCEEFKFCYTFWGLYPFIISHEMVAGRYGAVDFGDVFTLHKESFPVKPVIKNFYTNLKFDYYFKDNLKAYLQLVYLENPKHYINYLNILHRKSNILFGFDYSFSVKYHP
jgi:hypothetical protein